MIVHTVLAILFPLIYSARALQTVFKILSPNDFHLDDNMSYAFASKPFGVEEATKVLKK